MNRIQEVIYARERESGVHACKCLSLPVGITRDSDVFHG